MAFLGVVLSTLGGVGVVVPLTVELTILPFVFLLLLLLLLFLLLLVFGFLFLLLLLFFYVCRPLLLVLDEVFGFVESVTPAIGMSLRSFQIGVLTSQSVLDPSSESPLPPTDLLLLLSFAEVDKTMFLDLLS